MFSLFGAVIQLEICHWTLRYAVSAYFRGAIDHVKGIATQRPKMPEQDIQNNNHGFLKNCRFDA